MLDFLNNKLDKLGFNKVKYILPLISIGSDIILLIYINDSLLKRLFGPGFVHFLAKAQNIDPVELTPDYINMVIGAMTSSLSFMLWCILIYNCIIYALSMSTLQWPKTYVKGYAFSAVLLSVVEVAIYLVKVHSVNFITILTAFLYFIVYYGYRHFTRSQESQT